ncbi:MAG: hypothetical protein ACI90V_006103, partial [Bacillariaceae sp.]|jgi:hypothetical protein
VTLLVENFKFQIAGQRAKQKAVKRYTNYTNCFRLFSPKRYSPIRPTAFSSTKQKAKLRLIVSIKDYRKPVMNSSILSAVLLMAAAIVPLVLAVTPSPIEGRQERRQQQQQINVDNLDNFPTYSTEQYIYTSLYSSSDCSSGASSSESSLIDIVGTVTLEEYDVVTTTTSLSAIETTTIISEKQCDYIILGLIFDDILDDDDTGDDNGTVTTHRQIETVLDNGEIYSCATTNTSSVDYDDKDHTNDTDSKTYTGDDTDTDTDTDANWMCKYADDSCQENSLSNDSSSSSCSFSHNILKTSNLQDPNLFYNPSLNDQDMLKDYYYFIYYDNSDCTSNTTTRGDGVVGIKGYMSNVNYSVPHVNDGISCYDSMSCLYNQNGKSCQSGGRINNDKPMVAFAYTTTPTDPTDDDLESTNYLYSCEGTVVDQDNNVTSAGSGDVAYTNCVDVRPNECKKSGVFPSCYLRYISADYLARNPQYLIGNITKTVEEENNDDADYNDDNYNDKGTDSTAFHHPVLSLLLLLTLPSIIMMM